MREDLQSQIDELTLKITNSVAAIVRERNLRSGELTKEAA
jgi:hypothetical protein